MHTLSTDPTRSESTTFNAASSFTAQTVAYRRTFTATIPHAQEIWSAYIGVSGSKPSQEELEQMKRPRTAPFFEARYLMTDILLGEGDFRQVLEIASGLSGRGINTASRMPDASYVEFDLGEQLALKQSVVQSLFDSCAIPPIDNLYFKAGNALDPGSLRSACDHFRPGQPVAVICEGLLRYVSPQDRQKLGESIHAIIEEFGGAWITPDIEFFSESERPERRASYEAMAKQSGFDVRPNLFKDEADAEAFFSNLGFKAEKYRLASIAGNLSCPAILGLSESDVLESLRERWTYMMTIE